MSRSCQPVFTIILAAMLAACACGDAVSPLGDNVPARIDGEGRYILSAEFSTLHASRAAWDFPMRRDLDDADGIAFDWRCSDIALCAGFNVYFRSGKGWYTARFEPDDTNGWQRITVTKDMVSQIEGTVAGWGVIDTLRLGMWRGAKGKVEFGFANLSILPRDSQKDEVQTFSGKVQENAAAIVPHPGEWRAFWIHSPLVKGKARDWDGDMRTLKARGFNAILPNLAYAGTAFYRSSVLPVHPSVETEGDALDACLAACRKYGLECHVWNICWKTGRYADKAFLTRMEAEGRLQRGFDGKSQEAWLCPTHPANLSLEVASFVELAKKGVDGLHFDYIRYPGPDSCFCDGCRTRFEAQIGARWRNGRWMCARMPILPPNGKCSDAPPFPRS